ncbi:hypothetical protein [Mycobacterium parmense]|uniref:hypothetical protein n=1 Tax=Mycobacterium parmense TaxID=185642 RepID=UPI00111C3CE8|nr:hypothetical protein [Mycobacterium parmense]MCV7352739.1 hypothetical protein [Mycobacterium parmense]
MVDPARLETAGATLRKLALPAPPPRIVVDGTDSMSSAINATLPIVESPVIEGLPAVQAVLRRTGDNIVAAAEIYAETDQQLSGHVNRVEFVRTARTISGASSTAALRDGTGDEPPDAPPAEGEIPGTPQPGASLPRADRLAQYGQLAGTAGFAAQSAMQSAQGATGGIAGGAATPAQLDDTESPAADQAEMVDQIDQADGEGASESVPVQQPAAGQPTTTRVGA